MLHLCTPPRARKAVIVIVLMAILYNIPRFLEHETLIMPDYCRRVSNYKQSGKFNGVAEVARIN